MLVFPLEDNRETTIFMVFGYLDIYGLNHCLMDGHGLNTVVFWFWNIKECAC